MLVLVFIIILAVIALLIGTIGSINFMNECPQCHRELDPEHYSGWLPGQRRFCPWCSWREDVDGN
jgi:hypothetical protein